MKRLRNILLLAIVGFVLLGTLLFGLFRPKPDEVAARQKLDDLLGAEKKLDLGLPASPTPMPELPWPDKMRENMPKWPSVSLGESLLEFAQGLGGTAVDVQETEGSYILRVPLASPKDASQVQLNVTPNRIEISGQTGSQQHGAQMRSSFMQSFTTSQPVVPEKVQKKTETQGDKAVMVITIPKQQPGQSLPNPLEPSALERPSTETTPNSAPGWEPGLLDEGNYKSI